MCSQLVGLMVKYSESGSNIQQMASIYGDCYEEDRIDCLSGCSSVAKDKNIGIFMWFIGL